MVYVQSQGFHGHGSSKTLEEAVLKRVYPCFFISLDHQEYDLFFFAPFPNFGKQTVQF